MSGVPIRLLSSWGILAALEQLDRSARHDGRDRMLVDKLRVSIAPEQKAEVVEPGDDALQFDSVDQEDRERCFCFSDVVQEGVLQILCAFGRHRFYPVIVF